MEDTLALFSHHHTLCKCVARNNIVRSRFCRDEDGHLFYDVLVIIVATARDELAGCDAVEVEVALIALSNYYCPKSTL